MKKSLEAFWLIFYERANLKRILFCRPDMHKIYVVDKVDGLFGHNAVLRLAVTHGSHERVIALSLIEYKWRNK